MNIRRFWRLCSLTVASLFWASCTDSNSHSLVTQPVDSDSSADVNGNSSSEGLLSSATEPESSSATVPESSSSGNPVTSSASYVLARDPSVTCEKKNELRRHCYENCYAVESDLRTDELISENELTYRERALESCRAIEFASTLLYGSPANVCNYPYHVEVVFECSDDSTYKDCRLDSNRVYTSTEEYNEAHGISSSSVEQSSSSSEKMIKNCPHDELLPFTGILAEVQKELYERIVRKLEDDSTLSESGRQYLDSLLNHEKKTLTATYPPELRGLSVTPYSSDIIYDDYYYEIDSKNWFSGYIAKTKTCEDGTPVITERYQQKYDAILAECIEIIEEKIKPED